MEGILKYIKPSVELFDNQKSNVKALVHRRKALLTDRVGSGKSLSVLYAFSYLKSKGLLKNLLVLTPLSAYEKQVWKKDIQKFTNLKTIDIDTLSVRLQGRFNKLSMILDQYDVIYGKHSHVKQCLELMQTIVKVPTTMLVADEVHAFRNPKSALTLKFKSLSYCTKNFWGVTGSSLSKSMEDLYNIVNLISPWFLGSFTQFRDCYCLTREKFVGRGVKVNLIVGVKDEKALKAKLEPLVITGESFVEVKFHYLDYDLTYDESTLYRKIANGLELSEEMSSQDWIKYLLSNPDQEVNRRPIKEIERYSSRFIYLQSAADGILTKDGNQDRTDGTKVILLLDTLETIVAKGQSVLVYFDYYAPLEVVKKGLIERKLKARVLESTGEHVLKDSDITEAGCKSIPHIILGTKASSESASYYFINNVIFFHIPTVPHVFIQFVGRITRKSTLFPDDLNCYIFRSSNIDLYKLLVVSAKTKQLEVVQGEEHNVPDTYKQLMSKATLLEKMKKVLLWRT